MKKTLNYLVIATFTVLMVACSGDPPASTVSVEVTDPSPTAQSIDISTLSAGSYPSVDGSTSTHPLQVTIACAILNVECDWTEVDFFTSTRRIAPVDPLLSTQAHETIFQINHNGTHGSYVNLILGEVDLILVAREPSEDELSATEYEGVELDVRPVALDAFVFLVHRDNPVKSLTLDQIRAIYTGQITNWRDVGGVDAEIHTYRRNPNSGSQELMEKLVMHGEPMLDSPDMMLMSMMGPFSAIREDPLGIGYSVFFYAENIFPEENVRMLAIDQIEPTSGTIASGAYPLTTEVYAVMRAGGLQPALATTLRDWLFTPEGQETVQASGYVRIVE